MGWIWGGEVASTLGRSLEILEPLCPHLTPSPFYGEAFLSHGRLSELSGTHRVSEPRAHIAEEMRWFWG